MRSVAPKNTVSIAAAAASCCCAIPAACYTFNPLSVYFCYRADGDLAVLIYEVRNTFGDIHAYALAVKPDGISGAGVRQQQDKLLCLAVYRDGDALPLPGFAAGRRCQTAHSRD